MIVLDIGASEDAHPPDIDHIPIAFSFVFHNIQRLGYMTMAVIALITKINIFETSYKQRLC